MKKLLAIIPGRSDTISYYRGLGPLLQLKDAGWDVIPVRDPLIDWAQVISTDALYIMRPHLEEHEHALFLAKSLGRKVWIDYDDNLLAVPRSNPTHGEYSKTEVQERIKNILTHADVVSVSTEALANALGQHTKAPCRIIRNAFDPLFNKGEPTLTDSKSVMWRGSATHNEDLDEWLPAIAECHKRYPDWTWNFVGQPSYRVHEAIAPERIRSVKGGHFLDYFHVGRHLLKPAVAIVPLKDSKFNRSKSNIAWIEGTYFGASVVCPDWQEWQNPGAHLYKSGDQDSFVRAFSAAIEMRAESVDRSWKAIQNSFTLGQMNRARCEILSAIG